MKKLLLLAAAISILSSAAHAVTWDVVSASVVVKASSNTGRLSTTVLNARSYLNAAATANPQIPKAAIFLGLREDTGEISVVDRNSKTVLFTVVAVGNTGGTASTATGTVRSVSVNANIGSLSTTYAGFVYDTLTRSGAGAITTFNRLAIGGNGTQTVKGTFVFVGKKYNL